ncbi:MAG: hypothetical protein CMJ18_28225 [Phycisphaeraceae bacterium]|nr:hypothetical protein [Phycisphaeraceae bacterium]
MLVSSFVLTSVAHAAPQVLHAESFDDGRAVGWKYYDSSLDGRDASIDGEVTCGDSPGALFGESNAASVSLVKFLKQSSVSIPLEDDVYLSFAFHFTAPDTARDELHLYATGHDAQDAPIAVTVPIAMQPAVNRWHVVTIPARAWGKKNLGGRLDGQMILTWYRGAHDAHDLRLDDLRVTRGAPHAPLLVHPGTFQVRPEGIEIEQSRYLQRLRVAARLYRSGPWRVEISRNSEQVRSVAGAGRRVDVIWDGRDSAGRLLEPAEVEVTLVPAGQPGEPTPSTHTRTVNVPGGAFENVLTAPHAMLISDRTIDYGRRTAIDRIEAPYDEPEVFHPLTKAAIDVVAHRGGRGGVRLRLVNLEPGDASALSLQSHDLVGPDDRVLSAPDIQFRIVDREEMDLGFAWRPIRRVDQPLVVSQPVDIELSVAAPAHLGAGAYKGKILVDATEIALNVVVETARAGRQWWHDDKVRLMLGKPQVMPRPEWFYQSTEGYRRIAQAGFNVMIPYIGLRDHELIAGKAGAFDLKSIARTRAPAYPREDFHEPYFVWPSGIRTPLMCPFSEAFWNEIIFPQVLDLAEVSTKVPLVGMELDFEIYGIKGPDKFAHIYCHCYCDTCWSAMRKQHHAVPEKDVKARRSWLINQRKLGEYKVLQDRRLVELADALRQAVDTINPDVQFMLLAWDSGHFLELIAKSLGTERAPVILATERTYGRGRTPQASHAALANHRGHCLRGLAESRRMGLHSLYVPGVMPGHQKADPAFCRANAEIMSSVSDGYWVFFQQVEKPSTVGQNLEQFRRANARIVSEPW